MKNNSEDQIKKELNSFTHMWEGGYFEGDPLDPMAGSTYGIIGYMSVLHVVYLTCIKPFISDKSVVLEGPGRGAWTRTFLPAKEIWCLDALSAEHNRFWEYMGNQSHVKYFQVNDFNCQELPDNHFDYFFSFGTFCHISFEGMRIYMKSLYPKLKADARCFVMIADYKKFNSVLDNKERFSIISLLRPKNKFKRWVWNLQWKLTRKYRLYNKRYPEDEDMNPAPGRWYHGGIERTCTMLNKIGYKIIDPDVGAVHRDPIIHFIK